MADDLNATAEKKPFRPWDTKRSSAGSPHADKFRLVLASLIGIAVGALAVAGTVLASHDSGSSAPHSADAGPAETVRWSSWRPEGTGNSAAEQIAQYVAPFYRLSTSEELALITPVSVTQLDAVTGTFVGTGLTVALNTTSGSNANADNLRPLTGETVAFDLCGVGTSNCAVSGTPSRLRLLLLRREALELALYTLEYLPKSENVVVVLPPARTTTATKHAKPVTVALLFDRAQLTPLLEEPLEETLQTDPPTVPELGTWKKTVEAGLVDEVTSRNLFSESVESMQDDGTLLVLDGPLAAQ